ncbi:MAG: hypothetical protein EOP84_05105 [Verrucomicrobiaceae bacterium]|nr:MAG: hypothetical protein EOP84_05105 [Verrucomicrobiaceae bacterium]
MARLSRIPVALYAGTVIAPAPNTVTLESPSRSGAGSAKEAAVELLGGEHGARAAPPQQLHGLAMLGDEAA